MERQKAQIDDLTEQLKQVRSVHVYVRRKTMPGYVVSIKQLSYTRMMSCDVE